MAPLAPLPVPRPHSTSRDCSFVLIHLVMDTGHYNCRDYYISPHFAPTTVTSERTNVYRHESWQQLEERSRSPIKPGFPFLQLPLELRQKIYGYLLPRTLDHKDHNPLANHARNFSAVQKRGAKGMILPQKTEPSEKGPSHVVWKLGNTRLFSTCRQVHDECAEIMYGSNTFLLFLNYNEILFRFCWLLKSGLTPTRRYSFLELLPKRYLGLIKRIVVNVDHVDSYTGMIKFNVSGKGLTHGLTRQVRKLVRALQPAQINKATPYEERRLYKVNIRVSNGTAVLDQIKNGSVKIADDVEEMLEPFGSLRGVRNVQIAGAVAKDFSDSLAKKMMSMDIDDTPNQRDYDDYDDDKPGKALLCVYGNDI